ncbi:POTE ankyrin domain family member E-like [Mytilus californianus]|uniref:POTE ankyrin domain family member E-like n=1 Tax=Mytilus californianus TaxID=6549 RepID=UPI002245EBA3|nr:POTE ankyrin domain family member E-like [Mytilus californianus]
MAGQALLKAISAGRPRQVRLLLDSGCSADESDDCGQTALIRAIFVENEGSRLQILKMLLRKGTAVSKADIVGRNALSWACIYGRDKDVDLLLQNADLDLDLNYTDVNGNTPLYHAVSSGNAATVRLMVIALTKYDMSVDIPDYMGYSPLMHAVRLGFDVCASILKQNGKAKVGVNMKYPKDFESAEKWAVHSLSDRGKAVYKNPKFPAILEPETKNKIKYRENRASRSRVKTQYFSESDDDSSVDSEFSFPSDSSSCDNGVFDFQIKSFMRNYPKTEHIPSSILALSPTSSTIVNASEDEFDTFSCPLGEKQSTTNIIDDIPTLYGLISDQMSTSYRLPAKPAPITPRQKITKDSTMSSLTTENSNLSKGSKKGKKNFETQKWSALKKNLRLSRVKNVDKKETTPRDSPWKIYSDESMSDTEDFRMPHSNRQSQLPSIPVRKIGLVQNKDSNYSLI